MARNKEGEKRISEEEEEVYCWEKKINVGE